MMLSTPVASAQHAQHAHTQLHRAVRSTFSSGNRRRRWHRWHPVWMALATTKLRRCAGKKGKKRQWVAPTISANLGGEEIQMALGAVEVQQSTGCSRCSHCRVLYGQIFRDGKWCPVKLTETEPDLWIGGPEAPEAGPLTFSFDATMKRSSLRREAPGWPSELVEDLSRWPLKGPGTIVFDAHFFVQRGVSAVLSSGFPVLFVGAAQQMGLVTEDWIPGIAKHLKKTRSLCEVFGGTSLEKMIQDLPEDLRKGHFDIAGAIAGADSANEEHWSRVYTVKIQRPERLTIESCSWTLGAMLREPVSEVDAAVGDVLLKINGRGILWQSFDDIQELLVDLPGPAEITFGRPKVIQKIYLREAVASAEALSLFGDGVDGDGKVLVSQLAALLSRAGLVFAEDRPGLFAGDAGTASHLHVDRKPLLQFCHGLHGCKFFCVAPGKAPGPQVPWQSGAQLEAKLPTDAKLSTAAVEWMQSPEVSVCCLHPGDLLLFLGQSCHAGCNGAAQMSLSLFHGTMQLSYMLQGAFGVPYQLMARKLMS